jgi:hypothetical protein
MTRILGLAMLVIGASTVAYASVLVSAPELDAGTAVSALALLSGSLLVLRGRRKR